jgi:hypothetical protein
MKHERVLPRLIIIANILIFPYSTSPTPTDALEISMLSGRGDRMKGLNGGSVIVRDREGCGKVGAGV